MGAGDEVLLMPEASTNEVMMDSTAASGEKPRDSGMIPEFAPDMISFLFIFFLSVLLFANILFVFMSVDLL